MGPGWLYEIKHDGYRLMVRKTGDGVRIYTCRGVDAPPQKHGDN